MSNDLDSLASAREKFLNHLKSENRSVYTILSYGNDVRQLVDFLSGQKITQVGSVTQKHLEAFKDRLTSEKYAAKSISRKINAIKTFFRFLRKEGVIKEDPSFEVAHPKYETKPPRVLSRLEYRALRDACRHDSRIGAIVELMLQTGIRIGEVSRIETSDIGPDSLHIRAYESQSERKVPLNKAAKEALNRYLSERGKVKSKNVFITKTGKPLLIRNIRSAISRYFRLAGIKNATVNDLRNTWISFHLKAGTNLAFLAKMAGHKRISSTQKYFSFFKNGEISGKEEVGELKEL